MFVLVKNEVFQHLLTPSNLMRQSEHAKLKKLAASKTCKTVNFVIPFYIQVGSPAILKQKLAEEIKTLLDKFEVIL